MDQKIKELRMQVWNDLRNNYNVRIPAQLRDRMTLDQMCEIRGICARAKGES